MFVSRISAFLALLAIAASAAAAVPCPDTGNAGAARNVAAALNKLRPLLDEKQRAVLDQPLNGTTAIHWSNLPIGVVPRSGLRLGDLDARQTAAAQEVFKAVLSECGA